MDVYGYAEKQARVDWLRNWEQAWRVRWPGGSWGRRAGRRGQAGAAAAGGERQAGRAGRHPTPNPCMHPAHPPLQLNLRDQCEEGKEGNCKVVVS